MTEAEWVVETARQARAAWGKKAVASHGSMDPEATEEIAQEVALAVLVLLRNHRLDLSREPQAKVYLRKVTRSVIFTYLRSRIREAKAVPLSRSCTDPDTLVVEGSDPVVAVEAREFADVFARILACKSRTSKRPRLLKSEREALEVEFEGRDYGYFPDSAAKLRHQRKVRGARRKIARVARSWLSV